MPPLTHSLAHPNSNDDQRFHAPLGAANYPRRLNKDWVPGVRKFRDELEAKIAFSMFVPQQTLIKSDSGTAAHAGHVNWVTQR